MIFGFQSTGSALIEILAHQTCENRWLPPTTASMSNLPPADTFDFLPQLATLLEQLLPTDGKPGVDAKELEVMAGPLKVKIERAKAAVRTLPEVDRSIKQQRQDIKLLNERIKRQQEAITALSNASARALTGDKAG